LDNEACNLKCRIALFPHASEVACDPVRRGEVIIPRRDKLNCVCHRGEQRDKAVHRLR
jgi:hypothetical protein